MRRTSRYIAIIVSCVVIGGGFWLYHEIGEIVRDAYAVWWAADLVVAHMEANNDQWPKGWDELRADYDTCVKRSRSQSWSFEELKSKVCIDWSADPSELSKSVVGSEKPQFRVIWLRDGSKACWAAYEPNEIIADYLQRKQPGGQVTLSGLTMGTVYSVKFLQPATPVAVETTQQEVKALLERLEQAMSTYREDSEVRRFSVYRGDDWFAVSEDTARVAAESLRHGRAAGVPAVGSSRTG